MTKVSVLDFARLTREAGARVALDNSRDLAVHAERWGYSRYWVAEHHGYPGIAGGPTAVVLGHVGSGTSSLRIGAGGVMLPNHPPLLIAEEYGALAQLFPGRVDLGIGRSSAGAEDATVRALRRPKDFNGDISKDVAALQGFFSDTGTFAGVHSAPSRGTNVPVWILGTGLYGAQLAAKLGLPYVFGAHLSPAALLPAIHAYRSEFTPSSELAEPYVMVGLNVVAAPTDAEAARLATTYQMTVTDLIRGRPGLSQAPIDDIDTYWSGVEREQLRRGLLGRAIVGSPSTIREQLLALTKETGADELIIDSDLYHHQDRLASFEIIADVMGSSKPQRNDVS